MTGNCVLVGDAPASDSDSEAESPRPAGPHPVATASAARTPPRSGPGASRPHASHAYSTPRARPAASMTRVLASTPSPRPTPARPKITWSRGVNESTPIKVPTASTPPRVATVRSTPAQSATSRSGRDSPRSPETARPSEELEPAHEPADASSDAVVGRARREVKPSPVEETQARRAPHPPRSQFPLLSSSAAARSRSPSLISSRPRPRRPFSGGSRSPRVWGAIDRRVAVERLSKRTRQQTTTQRKRLERAAELSLRPLNPYGTAPWPSRSAVLASRSSIGRMKRCAAKCECCGPRNRRSRSRCTASRACRGRRDLTSWRNSKSTRQSLS